MNQKLLALWGLKFDPFSPEVPTEALYLSPKIENFCWRIEQAHLREGGWALIHGEPGSGKSVVMRVLAERLARLADLSVGVVHHPQSNLSDFYRELGDIFGVTLSAHNRWGGFKALRSRWCEHIASTLARPVLILDEAQEAPTAVLSELRLLASKDLDSRQLLSVVFAGDARLPERFRAAELLPLGSRIRRRLVLDYAARDELCACLDHLLNVAGNPSLMTAELKATLADHAAGNYRVLMNLADELLVTAADRDLPRLDEKLYFEVFAQPQKPKPPPRKR
jgi:general secretion pathway protein A